MPIVMYRVGIHRTSYHVDSECPALTGKRDTVEQWAAAPEEEAQEELGLEPCSRCTSDRSAFVKFRRLLRARNTIMIEPS